MLRSFSAIAVFLLSNQLAIGQLFGLPNQVRYTISSGLSNNSIMDIQQDTFGFLWIATADGLNRYDGDEFISFHPEPEDSNAISDSFIASIELDNNGQLWVATQKGGLNYYSYELDAFKSPESANLSNRQTDFFVQYGQTILCENEDYIWVGTSDGIIRIPILEKDAQASYPLTGLTVFCFLKDSKGSLWVGTSNGLLQYNLDKQSFLIIPDISFEKTGEVKTILEDENGNLLVGSKNGLFIHSDNKWKELKNSLSKKPASFKNINSLVSDKHHRIWIGGQQGLSVIESNTYQTKEKEIQVLHHNNFDKENIHILFIDREENLWVGTANNGIIRLFLSERHFPIFRQNLKPFDGGTPENTIRSIWSDNENTIWLGSYGAGLYRFDRDEIQFTNYRSDLSNSKALSGNQVSCIYRDQKGTLWVGTWGDGLNEVTSEKRGLQFFRHRISDNPQKDQAELSKIHQIFEDEYQNLWIVTNGGLAKKSKNASTFTEVTSFFDLPYLSINAILEDNQGNWWIGTWNGLFIFNQVQVQAAKSNQLPQKKAAIASFYYDKQNPKTLSNSRITSLRQDKKGRIWVGTYGGGLNLWQPKDSSKLTGDFKSYSKKEGLPNNVIYGIQEDDLGRLWMSTNKGLVLFDPDKEAFRTFTSEDGLQSNQFYFGAYGHLPNGEMAFGGNNGFNIFFPSHFSTTTAPPKTVILTNFQVRGEKVPIGKRADGTIVLSQSISQASSVQLQPYDNNFSIQFIAPSFNQASKQKYAFRMKGFNDDWQIVDNDNRNASWSNLKEGFYTFEVKTSTDEQQWSPIKSLEINISPPWYRTSWAYFLMILFAILFLFAVTRIAYVFSSLRHKLKLEQLNHQKEKEVNDMRLWFFTYISHEFRTPLTLIISPLKELINEFNLGQKARNKLLLTYKNSQRLLRLVNQILNFRMIHSGKIQLQTSEINLIPFAQEIFSTFSNHAQKRNIRYDFIAERESINLWFEAEKMELILYNLLSNAFKFSSDGGHIQLIIKETDTHAHILVKDKGIGIPASKLEQIFQPFQRMAHHQTSGHGIGLTLVKDLVELHDGNISVNSEDGKGTTFKLIFLKGKNHLKTEQILDRTEFMIKNDVLLNITEPSNSPSTVPQVFPTIARINQARLLIVEDNLDIRTYFKNYFEKDFNVYEASNGKEGLEMAQKYLPDLIISDVMMPVLDGINMLKKLKKDTLTNHIPIILLTSRVATIHQLQGFQIGAIEYIVKPVNVDILRAKVFSILNNIQILKTRYKQEGLLLPDSDQPTNGEEFLFKAIQIVEQNLENSAFNAQEFALQMGISRSGLYKKLQNMNGRSITQFIRFVRLKHAEKLLKEGRFNISETAFQVGFNDLKYFRRCFKEEFKLTPSDYLRNIQKTTIK